MEFIGTFFVTIISFLVFVFIMNKILYEPIGRFVAKREEFINEDLSSAHANREKAEGISEEKERKLRDARIDAKSRYATSVSEYKNKKNNIVNEARVDAERALNEGYAELESVSNEVKSGLKMYMNDLANSIAEKIIGYRPNIQNFNNEAVDNILYK